MTSAPRRQILLDDESAALTGSALVFAATVVVAAFVFWGRELPIDGRHSLGEFTAVAGAIAAAAAFPFGRLVGGRNTLQEPSTRTHRYLWFDLIALSAAHAAIALLGWIGIATVLDSAFIGATVYASPAVVLAAAAAALTAYLAFLSGAALSPRQLSVVLAVFLVIGMLTAMLSATDPRWWELNLSALGITHDISSLTFNLTLIVSGVIITTIARIGTSELPAVTRQDARRRTIVRSAFVLLGLLLSCVGIFPVDRFFLLHNTVATGMSVAYAALVIGLPWLVPTMPRVFIILGFVYVGAIIVLAVLFFLGVYNLTAVELVSALLIFSWIILFLRNVQTVGRRQPAA